MNYREYVDIVRELPIRQIIGESVELRRRGSRWFGLCPFHGERTPSFVVTENPPMFYCHGSCGEGGDLIKFVQLKEGLDFRGALKWLAERHGIQEPERSQGHLANFMIVDADEEVAKAVLNDLRAAHLKAFPGSPAETYLHQRRVSPEACATFKLGYCSPNAADIVAVVGDRKQALRDTGLTSLDKDGGPTDRYMFLNRVVFPVHDADGNMATFAGRALDPNALAKYINGRNGYTFRKGSTLYGMDVAKTTARRAREIYLVEGYLDVIGLHQAGIENVVAGMGTAFTTPQAKLIARTCKLVVLFFDGDAAGEKAVVRSLPALFSERLDVVVMNPPKTKDPFDMATEDGGIDQILDARRKAPDAVEFLLRMHERSGELRTATSRAAVGEKLAELFSHIPDELMRSAALEATADRLRLSASAMEDKARESALKVHEPRRLEHGVSTCELYLLGRFVMEAAVREEVMGRPDLSMLERFSSWPAFRAASELDASDPALVMSRLKSPIERAMLHDAVTLVGEMRPPSVEDCWSELRRVTNKKLADDTDKALKMAERAGRHELIDELLERKAMLARDAGW